MKWRGLEEAQTGFGYATLRAALDERRTLMEKYVPAESQALNRRVVEQLRDSGAAGRILGVGAKAPSFKLPDHNGVLWSSEDHLRGGPLVLIFFRGRWCPFCVAQLEAWNAIALRNCGTAEVRDWVRSRNQSGDSAVRQSDPSEAAESQPTLAAISPQTVHQSSLMHDQHRLGFSLLSDAGNRIARQFGLEYRVPEEQQQMYRRTFVNLPFINGDESWELPLPATYVIAADGTVRYATADPDYTRRPEPAEALAAL